MARRPPRAAKTSRAARAAHPHPTTEAMLRRVTIGELRRHDAPISLQEYDPNWPRLFLREKRRIRGALGPRAIRLEHVGSTSVPGLPAKPILDILLVVAESSDESSYVPALAAQGYLLRIRGTGSAPTSPAEGPGHERQPSRVLRRVGRDRSDAHVPGPVAHEPRGARTLRGHQTRPRPTHVEVRPELCGCEVGGRRDPPRERAAVLRGKVKSAVPPRSPVDVDGPEGVRGSRSSNPESPTGIDGLGGGTPGRRVRLRTDTEP